MINILALEDGSCNIPRECQISPIYTVIKNGIYLIILLIIIIFAIVYLVKLIIHLIKLKKAKNKKDKMLEKQLIKKIIIKIVIVFIAYILLYIANVAILKYINYIESTMPEYCRGWHWC